MIACSLNAQRLRRLREPVTRCIFLFLLRVSTFRSSRARHGNSTQSLACHDCRLKWIWQGYGQLHSKAFRSRKEICHVCNRKQDLMHTDCRSAYGSENPILFNSLHACAPTHPSPKTLMSGQHQGHSFAHAGVHVRVRQ